MSSYSSNPLTTCDPSFIPIASHREPLFMPRRAIDPSGHIGSFYDAGTDRIVKHSFLSLRSATVRDIRQTQCFLKKNLNKASCPNLMQEFNIADELRLSTAVGLIPAEGMGASINYSRLIDRYTRIICYSVYSRTDYVPDEILKQPSCELQSIEACGTHVIILVNYGIDACVVFQLPHDDTIVCRIDAALEDMCRRLSSNGTIRLMSDVENLLKRIEQVEIFSNIPQLTKIKSIIEFAQSIDRLKYETAQHQPYNYNLCPISHFPNTNSPTKSRYFPIPRQHIHECEESLLLLLHCYNDLKKKLSQDYPHCEKYLKDIRHQLDNEWKKLDAAYLLMIKKLQECVYVARTTSNQYAFKVEIRGDEIAKLKQTMQTFSDTLNRWRFKESFIKDLLPKDFGYQVANRYNVKPEDDETTLRMKLLGNEKDVTILCGTDDLYNADHSQWNTMHGPLVEKKHRNPSMKLVYVDFSYDDYLLKEYKVFTSNEQDARFSESRPTSLPKAHRESDLESVNILLFGESGVGKSTFINALVNYLRFDTFQQADQDKPIVLLPISFIVTTGHDFEEHHVTYPGIDAEHHEVHDQPGQSVTQHCRSYVFTISDETEKKKRKIRLIDSPGVGDVRGVDQDEKNMQDIFLYINSLPRLHAICIVMKPNVARFNVLFRSCLLRLLDMLGEDARDRILFCFTNTRATFYAPGDTGPLLKKLLESLPVKNISFRRENTFCFDSESFRYLVAKQRGVQFDSYEADQFKETWNRSSKEAKRFFECIFAKSSVYEMKDGCRSVAQSQLEIRLLIRPLMEAMRNLFRNLLLLEKFRGSSWIELEPRAIRTYTAVCDKCPRKPKQLARFWICEEEEHGLHQNCSKCPCPPDAHRMIHHLLKYQVNCTSPPPNEVELRRDWIDLCKISAELAHFLPQNTRSTEDEPFLLYLKRMIEEETFVVSYKEDSQFNSSLTRRLRDMEETYKSQRNQLRNRPASDLSSIFGLIEKAKSNRWIQSQWTAIQNGLQSLIKLNEYQVSLD